MPESFGAVRPSEVKSVSFCVKLYKVNLQSLLFSRQDFDEKVSKPWTDTDSKTNIVLENLELPPIAFCGGRMYAE